MDPFQGLKRTPCCTPGQWRQYEQIERERESSERAPKDDIGGKLKEIYLQAKKSIKDIYKNKKMTEGKKDLLRKEIINDMDDKIHEILPTIWNKKFSNYSKYELLAYLRISNQITLKDINDNRYTLEDLHNILNKFNREQGVEFAESVNDALRKAEEKETSLSKIEID